MNIVFAYLLTLPVMAGLDLLWLGVVMKDFYQSKLGHLLSAGVSWPAAIAFYLMYALGVMYFASYPAFAQHSLVRALTTGALLGLFAYATYDLTNIATLSSWPLSVTVVDILWGGVITAAVSCAGYFLLGLFA